MCWVMPPASPAATSVSRIASSSEVLPWSTWPMIVTTGGRSSRLASESSNSGASASSSAAVTISILRSYSSAIALIESSVRVCVRVAISPIVISFLITSALPRPSSSATSRTVAPDWTLVASGSAASTFGGGSSSSGRRRLPPLRRGGRCGGGPPIWSRRAAWESITTRRFFAPPAAAGWPLSLPPRFGRFLLRAGFLQRGFRLRLFRFRLGFRGGFGRRLAAVLLGGGERLQRVGLLDAGGGGFRLDPGRLQRGQQLFAAQTLGFGDFMNPLLCH